MEKYKMIHAFLDHLEVDKREQVLALRSIILKAQPDLIEHIKWNAPSYLYKGEDRLTFNLINKQQLVMLVFHMGVKRPENKKAHPIMDDQSGLISWNSDCRGTMSFKNIADIESKSDILTSLIVNWLSID